jgi:pimeloyl-ACP methyl ester carboxylesterase
VNLSNVDGAADEASPPCVTSEFLTVAGLKMLVRRAGAGEPLVLFHNSTGFLGWGPFHEALSQNFEVIAPDLPGFGGSERPTWARNVRDLAILTGGLIDALDLGPVHAVGGGFGGWMLAELATMAPARFSSLALIGAVGPKPREGFVLDQMLMDWIEYLRVGFVSDGEFGEVFGEVTSELFDSLEASREMTARVSWKPFMYNRGLAALLPLIDVPTVVISGDTDRVVPIDVTLQYEENLPRVVSERIERAGHRVDLEQPEEIANLILANANHRGQAHAIEETARV